MKTKQEIIKEIENLEEQEYWDWESKIIFGPDEESFLIDPFPHNPYFHPHNDNSSFLKRSYKFYTNPEEIRPENLVWKERDSFLDPTIITEPNPVIIKHELFPMHYSHDIKVWEWDWDKIKKNLLTWKTEIADYIYGVPDQVLVIIREKMIQVGLQCKLVPYCDNYVALRVRIGNFKNYIKFRESLLELSRDMKIRSTYDYEEIRKIIKEYPVTLIM